jgi:hypothetical protein
MSGDFLVGAASVAQWLALGIALVLLAREIGAREPFGTTAAGLVLALAPIRLQVGTGYVEIPLAVSVIAAVAFAIRHAKRGRPADLVICAAAMGLACAIKIIVLPFTPIVLGMVAIGAVRRRQWKPIAIAAAAFVALASPWMIYNTIDTGAPLSPASVKVAGLTLGESDEAIAHMRKHPEYAPGSLDKEWEAFTRSFNAMSTTRESLGWTALIPLVVFLASLPWLRPRFAALLLFLVVGANLATVYSPALGVWRQVIPENFSRFMLTAFTLAIPASVAWCARAPFWGRLYRALLLLLTFRLLLRYATIGVAAWELGDISMTLAGVALLVGLGLVLRRVVRRFAARAAALAAAVVVVLAFVDAHRATHHADALRFSQYLHGVHRFWVDGALLVDKPGTPMRVCV